MNWLHQNVQNFKVYLGSRGRGTKGKSVLKVWSLNMKCIYYFIFQDKVETEPGFSVGNPATVHRNNQDEDTTNSLGEDDEDIDQYFNDLFPDRNRLDTVEEGQYH